MNEHSLPIKIDLAKDISLWQQQLLDSRRLAERARHLRIPLETRTGAYELWRLGILRADRIRSTRKLQNSNLHEASYKDGVYTYVDDRPYRRRSAGVASKDVSVLQQPKHLELLFHPYRLYVVHKIQQTLELNISPATVLHAPSRYAPLAEELIAGLNRRSGKAEFKKLIGNWQFVAEMAILSEPFTNEEVFGNLRLDFRLTAEQVRSRLDEYGKRVCQFIQTLDKSTVKKAHKSLCQDSEIIDDNKQLHIVLRLVHHSSRKKLKGHVGAAMHFLAMAESIRRAAERAYEEEWPEEDERGFGTYIGSKKEIYGARRLSEPSKDRISIIRRYGLDYAPKVRWYVEGDTEFYALNWILSRNLIELVNLRGQVVQKGALGFRDSLRSDIEAKRISLVMIDGDRPDFLRVLRKAVEADELCGMFFVNYPDFEFGNFSHAELVIIAKKLAATALQDDLTQQQVDEITEAVQTSSSGAELEKKLSSFGVGKGGPWGEAMMEFAWSNPELPPEPESKKPIIDAIQMAVLATSVNWDYQRSNYIVDPISGKSIPRE